MAKKMVVYSGSEASVVIPKLGLFKRDEARGVDAKTDEQKAALELLLKHGDFNEKSGGEKPKNKGGR